MGGHRNWFCRKAMLSFGSHQAPLYRGSRQRRGGRNVLILWCSTPCRHSRSDFTQDASYNYYRSHKQVSFRSHNLRSKLNQRAAFRSSCFSMGLRPQRHPLHRSNLRSLQQPDGWWLHKALGYTFFESWPLHPPNIDNLTRVQQWEFWGNVPRIAPKIWDYISLTGLKVGSEMCFQIS